MKDDKNPLIPKEGYNNIICLRLETCFQGPKGNTRTYKQLLCYLYFYSSSWSSSYLHEILLIAFFPLGLVIILEFFYLNISRRLGKNHESPSRLLIILGLYLQGQRPVNNITICWICFWKYQFFISGIFSLLILKCWNSWAFYHPIITNS